MPYLTQLLPEFEIDTDDLEKCHAFVRRVFPNEARVIDGKNSPVTPLHFRDGMKFITVSQTMPVAMPNVLMKTKKFEPKIQDGWQLPFRLKANPTVTKAGSRVGILDNGERMKWLSKALSESGCEVVSSYISAHGKEQGCHRPGQPPMTFNSVTYQGTIKVRDKAKLVNALMSGIGRGKAYGFGMLLLG